MADTFHDNCVNPDNHRGCINLLVGVDPASASRLAVAYGYTDILTGALLDNANFVYALNNKSTFEYLVSKGKEFDLGLIYTNIKKIALDVFEYVCRLQTFPNGLICDYAAASGRHDILNILYEKKYPMGNRTFMKAASSRCIKTIKFLIEKEIYPNSWEHALELMVGNMDLIRLFISLGYSFRNERYLTRALFIKDPLSVSFFIDNGCRMSRNSGIAASKYGDYNIIKKMHKHGCFFDINSIKAAISVDNAEGLRGLMDINMLGISVPQIKALAVAASATKCLALFS